jgi:hypothetical protein
METVYIVRASKHSCVKIPRAYCDKSLVCKNTELLVFLLLPILFFPPILSVNANSTWEKCFLNATARQQQMIRTLDEVLGLISCYPQPLKKTD